MRKREGFTLIEVVLALALLGVFSAELLYLTDSSISAFRRSQTKDHEFAVMQTLCERFRAGEAMVNDCYIHFHGDIAAGHLPPSCECLEPIESRVIFDSCVRSDCHIAHMLISRKGFLEIMKVSIEGKGEEATGLQSMQAARKPSHE